MRTLFSWAGIDYVQWRALARTALRIDLRAAGGHLGRHTNSSGLGAIALLVSINGAMGLVFAFSSYFLQDLLLSASLFLTYVSFAILLTVLLDFHAIVTSPDDYTVLGFRPISPRTYFAARLTNLFVFIGLVATALGFAPALAYTLRSGLVLGAASAVATYLTALSTSLAAVLVYAWVVAHVRPARLTRVLTYVQLALMMTTYAGVVLIPQLLERQGALEMTLPRTPWLHLHPAVWFARYLEIAEGISGPAQIGPAVASLVLLAVLMRAATGQLSLDYAERLGELSVDPREPAIDARRSRGPAPWFARNEARAVSVLVGAQFRNDQKFRLAVLTIVPLTFFYVLLALRDGTLMDPFIAGGMAGQPVLLYNAVLLCPALAHINLTQSDSYRAAWIFYATPASPVRVVRAMKNYLMATIVLPYLGALAVVFAWCFEAWWHVAVHVAMLLLLAHLSLLVTVSLDPELPFARPIRRGDRSVRFVVMIGLMSVLGGLGIPLIQHYLYPSAVRIGLMLGGLFALNAAVDGVLRYRLRIVREAEFAG